MIIYTKDMLIEKLCQIRSIGWIRDARTSNSGGIGNTLEDLLGITENNLPLPNAGEWELKCQRIGSASLTTLFHMEPSPRALKFVPEILLKQYGWAHQSIPKEKSFRQTINGLARSDRGFTVIIDRAARKVLISFDAESVAIRHRKWLATVKRQVGLGELNPQPYWGFDDLSSKARTKLLNCFYIQARTKKEQGIEYFCYEKIMMLERFDFDQFLKALEEGILLLDFDARTGHNHGAKFRLRQDQFPYLYHDVQIIAQ
jgi:hypothetical protein